jgi:hypothetical protein
MTEQTQSAPTEQVQTSQPSEASQPSFSVPEAYQGKGWVEKVKSNDDLWKTLDNAQSLLGKRPAGIPTNDAPQEEWDKFFQSARPADPNGYQLPDIEGLPEGVDLASYKAEASQLLYKAGLTQKQAAIVWDEYLKMEMGHAKDTEAKMAEQAKALDAEFDELVKETFGDKYDVSAKAAQDLINAYVPDKLKNILKEEAVNNPKVLTATIAALAGAQSEIDKIKKEYGAEGSITSGGQVTGGNIEEVRKELADARTKVGTLDPFSPERRKMEDRIKELSGIVQKAYNK